MGDDSGLVAEVIGELTDGGDGLASGRLAAVAAVYFLPAGEDGIFQDSGEFGVGPWPGRGCDPGWLLGLQLRLSW